MSAPGPDLYAEDGDLVRRAQAGDEEAMAAIYRRNVQTIYRYVYHRVGDEVVADDLTSEVFLRAVQSIGRYQHRGAPLAAWLYRIARDRVSDHYRLRGRRPTEPLQDDLIDTEPDPESTMLGLAETDELRAALEGLTDEQNDVIYFRFNERLSLEETAAALGKTVGAIKALQFRALQALARRLR